MGNRWTDWGTIAFIVAGSLVLWLGIVAPDQIGPFLTADSTWAWIGRLVGLGAFVGAILAVVLAREQLLVGLEQLDKIHEEQSRIRQELARRPDLRIGFLSPSDPANPVPLQMLTVSPEWSQSATVSDPIGVTFLTYNAGLRSARDLMWTYIFEEGWEPYDHLGEGAEGEKAFIDAEGRTRMLVRKAYLHPEAGEMYVQVLRVPRGITSFHVEILVSQADAPAEYVVLEVIVAEHRADG